jgi:formylglycine-generating enzyme required for sulfatase activity
MKTYMKITMAFLLFGVAALAGCFGGGGDTKDDSGTKTGTKTTLTAGGVSFTMVYVDGGYTCPIGTAEESSATVEKAYWMAQTELTYKACVEVYLWATGDTNLNGSTDNSNSHDADGNPTTDDNEEVAGAYKLANAPCMAGESAYETPLYGLPFPMSSTELMPADHFSWRDAMVFCNALTEWFNYKNNTSLTCVYCSDSAYAHPIRTSTSAAIDLTAGSQDNPYVNPNATGFRLPRSSEWELAARYIDGVTWNKGNHVSGDTSAPVNVPGITGSTIWMNYAEFNSTYIAAVVGSKRPNGLDIYDMSGNFQEYCFDWYTNGETRILMGGHLGSSIMHLALKGYNTPVEMLGLTTLRLVKSAQ